jgi:hypothetical protein
MARLSTNTPIGPSDDKINIAVQRPNINVKEAENVAEQANAVTQRLKGPNGVTYSRHGTFGPSKPNPLEQE